MKVTREDLPQHEVLLSIEVEAEDLDPYMDRAYRRVVQRANVPGFRKGKAPRAVLERYVGQDALLDEAVEFLVPEVVEKAVAQEQIEAGGRPSIEVVERDPVLLKATVPLVPTVVLDAYRDIRVQPEVVEVNEDQVQNVLESTRWELAPWEPAERPVVPDDQVTLDVRIERDDREESNQKGIVYFAAADNPSPVPGFAEALVGMEAGQHKEFTLNVPPDYDDQRLAGNEYAFHVSVHQVKEKRLPELDDEFAKGVGEGFDNLEALREKVREDIRGREELAARRRYEDSVVEELLARATVELSPLLVEHELDHLLQDEQGALRRQQMSMEQYLELVGKSSEEHRDESRGGAVARLERMYALRKVAELEELAGTPEEVDEELKSMAEAAGPRAAEIRRNLDSPEGRDSVAQMIVGRKVMARLVEIAKGEQTGSTVPVLEGPAEESSSGGTQDAGVSG